MGTLPAWPQRRPPRKGNFPPLSVMAGEGSGGSGTHTTGGKDPQRLPTPVTPPNSPPNTSPPPPQQVWAPGSTATCRLRFFSGKLCLPELPPTLSAGAPEKQMQPGPGPPTLPHHRHAQLSSQQPARPWHGDWMIYMGAASANQIISGRAGGLPRCPGRDPSSLPSPACCGHRQAPRPHPWEAQKHVHLGTRPCSTGDLGSLTAGSVPGGRSWDTEVLEECPLGRDM